MELDEITFNAVMSQQDQRLASDNVAIPGRPIQATIAIFQQYSVSGPIAHPCPNDFGFPVSPLNLSDHVHRWCQDRYGEKLKIDPSPGRFPILIEGAAYECRLPLAVGEYMVVGAKGNFTDTKIINAVDFVKDLPLYVRERLTASIENLLQVMFVTCMEVAKELLSSKSPLLTSAKSDILISCDLQCGYHVNTSLSSWHALQFAEKVLKEYISKSDKIPHIHKITDLKDRAEGAGYRPDSGIDWKVFDFNASARYDPKLISHEVAVKANHEAWRIGYNVLKQL